MPKKMMNFDPDVGRPKAKAPLGYVSYKSVYASAPTGDTTESLRAVWCWYTRAMQTRAPVRSAVDREQHYIGDLPCPEWASTELLVEAVLEETGEIVKQTNVSSFLRSRGHTRRVKTIWYRQGALRYSKTKLMWDIGALPRGA